MLKLAEHFISINGEGQRAGELALFFRFTGCNLRCAWCDTQWANAPDAGFTPCTVPEITDIALAAGIHNITLTGGEPLLQEDMRALIGRLCDSGFSVEIETNGAVSLAHFIDLPASFTMDYKLPSSGMESRMCMGNFPLLRETDTLKFVCGSQEDLRRAKNILDAYKPGCKVYFSPVFGQIEPAAMVDFMKENRMNGVRLQLQLHKFIWDPNERGV